MEKTIKGSIGYELHCNAEGQWDIKYDGGVENEMAVLAIAQHVVENCVAQVSISRKDAKGRAYKSLTEQLNKFRETRFGLDLLCNIMYSNHDNYLEYKKNHEESMKTAELSEEEKKAVIDAYAKAGHAAPDNHVGKP
jgi:hypothetical protein